MIAMGVIIIVVLILTLFNIDRLVDNAHSTNKYLSDISNKLDNIIGQSKS